MTDTLPPREVVDRTPPAADGPPWCTVCQEDDDIDIPAVWQMNTTVEDGPPIPIDVCHQHALAFPRGVFTAASYSSRPCTDCEQRKLNRAFWHVELCQDCHRDRQIIERSR